MSTGGILTQIGPGIPMGTLTRQYWMPRLLPASSNPDRAPVRLKLLVENLIAFHDTDWPRRHSLSCGLTVVPLYCSAGMKRPNRVPITAEVQCARQMRGRVQLSGRIASRVKAVPRSSATRKDFNRGYAAAEHLGIRSDAKALAADERQLLSEWLDLERHVRSRRRCSVTRPRT